ncbi:MULTISPECIES: hypothetical protein [unclassified Mucilaginibacter]|jgi:hypothetical protein|uniref:hypothetical protein n=1 Tax=unclassified Mucilaginibacter TaxID=2617802 RepID=UPI0008CE3430|nr:MULTISPECIES: hypothetical protein [unclassified Mucilaginibacter]WDF75860.1 hypothetical protein PQ469_18390 [Mucilaginibacter sp. KACC 22773]SEO68341.1 hypothetical protein SAMN05428947_103395 [Mucilaginibacter sp. OK283]
MNTQVEIFKTDVVQECEAATLIRLLSQHLPHCRINFDLEDCDRILRIESAQQAINLPQVIHIMNRQGYACTLLT